MGKPILCLDFDGVVHSYTSGWKGVEFVADPPVPGALEFIVKALPHFEVHIFSSRSGQRGGRAAMKNWLLNQYLGLSRAKASAPEWWVRHVDQEGILNDGVWPEAASRSAYRLVHAELRWPSEKPPAFVTIDDRAITFDGTWPSIDWLLNFKPWNKRPSQGQGAA